MTVDIRVGDCLEVLRTLDAESVQCCVTSPPYFGLRDYGVAGQIGLEQTPDAFVAKLVEVFGEVRRVLADDGVLWLNLGDSYTGSGKQATNKGSQSVGCLYGTGKTAREAAVTNVTRQNFDIGPKQLIGIPWRVALALQADGWYLRSDIIWHKPNPMPESVTDRPTKAHEYLFLLTKSPTYYYDADAIAEPLARDYGAGWDSGEVYRTPGESEKRTGLARGGTGHNGFQKVAVVPETRNKRSVWTIATQPFSEAHFATFPPKLIEPCILAGSRKGDTILDPFGGAGTTGLVADRLGRNALLIELNPEYAAMARRRITDDAPLFADGAA